MFELLRGLRPASASATHPAPEGGESNQQDPPGALMFSCKKISKEAALLWDLSAPGLPFFPSKGSRNPTCTKPIPSCLSTGVLRKNKVFTLGELEHQLHQISLRRGRCRDRGRSTGCGREGTLATPVPVSPRRGRCRDVGGVLRGMVLSTALWALLACPSEGCRR